MLIEIVNDVVQVTDLWSTSNSMPMIDEI